MRVGEVDLAGGTGAVESYMCSKVMGGGVVGRLAVLSESCYCSRSRGGCVFLGGAWGGGCRC